MKPGVAVVDWGGASAEGSGAGTLAGSLGVVVGTGRGVAVARGLAMGLGEALAVGDGDGEAVGVAVGVGVGEAVMVGAGVGVGLAGPGGSRKLSTEFGASCAEASDPPRASASPAAIAARRIPVLPVSFNICAPLRGALNT